MPSLQDQDQVFIEWVSSIQVSNGKEDQCLDEMYTGTGCSSSNVGDD